MYMGFSVFISQQPFCSFNALEFLFVVEFAFQ